MIRAPILFLHVLIIATCGLVYELLAGTLASYVLGDSVTQFSLIIGIYLFALGAGAWLSGFIDREIARRFVEVELAVALIGGASAPLLFLSFARLSYFHLILYLMVFIIGALVGLELPLLMRILKDVLDFKELVSRVLTFDYIGALFASLLFPLFLVPRLGLVRTSLIFGILNAGVGLWGTWVLRPVMKGNLALLRVKGAIVVTLLAIGVIKADRLTLLAEEDLYSPDTIVYSRSSPYQRIVVTRGRGGFQLLLNSNLQFNSVDEYRYHEALVHPAMSLALAPRRALVLGGGDGLALREIFRYPSIESVTLVDLDPDMTRLSERFPPLAELNGHAFSDPRLTVINQDAFIWIEEPSEPYDVVIIDFPDPNTFALGKLYTTRFYKMLRQRLTADAVVAIQSTSPLLARKSFWCIVRTIEAAGFYVKPYQVAVPSFGVWGYALAAAKPFDIPSRVIEGLRFLDEKSMAAMFVLPTDLGPVDVEVNRLDNQSLVHYYESEWKRFE
ncbi:MAG: polyamine aminopropyltransferase [Acidobacteriota bacterium]